MKTSVLQNKWIDGILLALLPTVWRMWSQIRAIGLPLVHVDRWVQGCDLPQVTSNNREVSAEAVRLLYQSGGRRMRLLEARCIIQQRLIAFKAIAMRCTS
jgi:DNA-binding LacI/PurR family transcriptional regulator